MIGTRAPAGPSTTVSPGGLSSFPTESAPRNSYERAAGSIGLLEGTELIGEFKGSGYREASRLICRSDGRVVRLDPVLYAVVTALDRYARASPASGTEILSRVADDVRDETGLELTADHIAYLMDRKLAPAGITTTSIGARPAIAKSQPFLSLRFKKAVLPSSATWFLGGLFSWLFRPAVVVLALTAALVSEIWLFGTQPMGSALAQALADPASVLLVAGLAVVSAFFHEIGHATACRYSGVRPGAIGCGLYVVWPAFYTDITSSYRLERSGRLRTVLGGVYFNALFIIGLALLYFYTGSPILLATILIVNLELVQQLLPTLRFDGYYIVSDMVGIPDLFKYIGPILKRTLLRQPADERLQALKTWPQRVVTIWVLVVIPVLIAQLTFVLFQLPQFMAIGWQRIKAIGLKATAPGSDVLGLLGDVTLTVLALLPLAGLLVLVMQAGRGVTNILRNLQNRAGEPANLPQFTGELSGRPPSRDWHRRSLGAKLLPISAVVLLIIGAYVLSVRGSGSVLPARLSSPDSINDEPIGRPPVPPRETTTTLALPAGHDEVVQTVIDGDTFQSERGNRIRLVGIDAPDSETGECFSAEAKAALADLLVPGRTVRVVDEVNFSDEFGRTVAYVYRLPDGLLVNLTLARDGFAYPASREPADAAYAAELRAAVREAEDAGRGIWSSCARRPTTASNTGLPDVPPEPTSSDTETPPPATPPPASPPTTLPPVVDLLDKLLRSLFGPK